MTDALRVVTLPLRLARTPGELQATSGMGKFRNIRRGRFFVFSPVIRNMSQPPTTTIVPQTELEREVAIAERLEEEERAGMAARWEEETSKAREAAAATKAASLEAE